MATVRLVALSVLFVACGGTPDRQVSRQDKELLARGVDTRVSTYKDPQPPRTSPRPALAPHEDPVGSPLELKISGHTRNEAVPGLRFRVPVEWRRVPEVSPDDRPRFIIPGPGGDAELAVYQFAADTPEAQAAYRHWRSRFTQAGGAPQLGAAEFQAMVRGPLQVTLVDFPGTAGERALPESPHRHPGPGDRILGAIVEGIEPAQNHFFVAVGPAPTLALWEQAFADFTTTFAIDFPP